jgi:hypothetical protein
MKYQSPSVMEMGEAAKLVQGHTPIIDEFRGHTISENDLPEADD